MASYSHQPLKDPSSEIRLVHLQPGHHDDPIKVAITHVSLKDEFSLSTQRTLHISNPNFNLYPSIADFISNSVSGTSCRAVSDNIPFPPHHRTLHPLYLPLHYEAVSYAWGDPRVTTPITIHDAPFEVTVNLEAALRHLRLEKASRELWIDAICIQQLDAQERDQQIRIMGWIYAKATSVVVWLGPEADDSHLALETIGHGFSQKIIAQEMAENFLPETSTQNESTRRLKAVVALFNRTWWRRGWIIQEVLARENVRIYCGRTVTQWKTMCDTIENIEGLSWRSQRSTERAGYSQTQSNDRLWDDLVECSIPARLLFRLQGLDLEGWLHCLRFFNTTDHKDKFWIAALLAGDSVFNEGQGPQYGWSLVQTYSFIVPRLIERTKDLRVLEHCSFDSVSGLPSWVPDWRVPKHAPLSDWRVNNTAGACSEPFYEIIDTTLHLKGMLLDTAKDFPPILLRDDVLDVKNLLQEAASLGVTYAPTNEFSKNALIRVVHANLAQDVQEAYDYLLATSEEQDSLVTPLAYPVVKHVSELDIFAHTFFVKQRHACKYAFTGRKYFRSSNGYIGLVPEATQDGDKICIFFGGNTPFVVRPSGENYLLIGACYVHGIMNGEAMVSFERNCGVQEDFFIV